jgi:probable HAF family extracellular repeat protein
MIVKHRLVAAVAVLLAASVLVVGAAAEGRAIRDLGTPGSGERIAVTGMNDAEQIIFDSSVVRDGRFVARGFLWSDEVFTELGFSPSRINQRGDVIGGGYFHKGGVGYFLGTLGGDYVRAYGLNDADQVVGSSNETFAGQERAFIWQNGVMTNLTPALVSAGLNARCVATAINNVGQVAGWCGVFQVRYFLWENGAVTVLNPSTTIFTGCSSCGGADALINDRGQVVVPDYVGGSDYFWDGQLTKITVPGWNNARAVGLNADGYIAGNTSQSSPPIGRATQPFLWHAGSAVAPNLGLGTAVALNDRNEVLLQTDGGHRTAVWEDGTLTDIGDLGGSDTIGSVINNNGDVAGTATTALGEWHLFLSTPTVTVTRVTIDIRPGSTTNPINLVSKGVVPVAILTTDSFDATTVDPASVCFGDAEDSNQRDCSESHGTGHIEDVNGDGRPDLLLHFDTRETGIDAGDTTAALTGKTLSGTSIEGSDTITVR